MKRHVFAGGLVLLSGLGAVAAACSSSPNETGNGDGGDAGSGSATFTDVYGQILSVSCGSTGLFNCHGSPDSSVQQGSVPNSELDFSSKETAYNALYKMMATASLAVGETTTTACAVTPDSGVPPFILVTPGNVQESLLYEKVGDPTPPCGMRMPLNHNDAGIDFNAPFVPLTDAQITLIADWINAGALDN